MSPVRTGALSRAMALGAAVALAAACTDAPTAPRQSVAAATRDVTRHDPPAPSGLVSIVAGGQTLTLWPYTGTDFSGTPGDPINAVFTRNASPLQIRAALRRLDGNRSAFGLPVAPPFDCTWHDAIGDEQSAFAEPDAWTGGAVQLACGPYGPLRLHLRLFAEGPFTLGGVHMDLQIPNTTSHQSISWELPEQILAIDMIRTGLLGGPPQLSAPINQAPTYGEIPAVIYNGIPPALRALIGGPPGNVTAPVPIPNDGRARLFDVATAEPVIPDVFTQDLVIQFNQVIPKPFCGGPGDFVLVQGPVTFHGVAAVNGGGTYHRRHSATGELTVTPVNPATGQAIAPPVRASVIEEHRAIIDPAGAVARQFGIQRLFGADGSAQSSLTVELMAGTIGHDDFQRVERCSP